MDITDEEDRAYNLEIAKVENQRENNGESSRGLQRRCLVKNKIRGGHLESSSATWKRKEWGVPQGLVGGGGGGGGGGCGAVLCERETSTRDLLDKKNNRFYGKFKGRRTGTLYPLRGELVTFLEGKGKRVSHSVDRGWNNLEGTLQGKGTNFICRSQRESFLDKRRKGAWLKERFL